MVGMRPVYQITCVQKLFPHIKGGAKVADYLLKAIAEPSFFQAFAPIPTSAAKTPWDSRLSSPSLPSTGHAKTTTFKQVHEETG
jgi:hypothetical protein